MSLWDLGIIVLPLLYACRLLEKAVHELKRVNANLALLHETIALGDFRH